MSRVSATQYETLVTFMENHGDLSRPCDGPHGRSTNITNWDRLVEALNADLSGCTKTEEKWRRTWSDLKNNLKKKVAKINKSSNGTGGGPATKLVISKLEERVLAIMNPIAATGITTILEVGISQDNLNIESTHAVPESSTAPAQEEPMPVDEEEVEPQPQTTHSQIQQPQPQTTHSQRQQPQPQTTHSQRQHSPTAQSPPLRRGRQTINHLSQSEVARQAFINSDREWRAYQTEKNIRNHEIERERLRLREIELAQQAKWQELFSQLLAIAEKFAGNFTK